MKLLGAFNPFTLFRYIYLDTACPPPRAKVTNSSITLIKKKSQNTSHYSDIIDLPSERMILRITSRISILRDSDKTTSICYFVYFIL